MHVLKVLEFNSLRPRTLQPSGQWLLSDLHSLLFPAGEVYWLHPSEATLQAIAVQPKDQPSTQLGVLSPQLAGAHSANTPHPCVPSHPPRCCHWSLPLPRLSEELFVTPTPTVQPLKPPKPKTVKSLLCTELDIYIEAWLMAKRS